MDERIWDFLVEELVPFLGTSTLTVKESSEILYYICKGFNEKEVK